MGDYISRRSSVSITWSEIWTRKLTSALFGEAGCGHELCTRCALYLCSTNTIPATASSPPGSIPCPLCRHGIVSFVKLPTTISLKELAKVNMTSLTLCTACTVEFSEPTCARALIQKGEHKGCCGASPLPSTALRLTCPGLSSLNCPGGFGSNGENSGSMSPTITCSGFPRSDSRSGVRSDDSTTIESLAWPLPSRVPMLQSTSEGNPPPSTEGHTVDMPRASKPACKHSQRQFPSSNKVASRSWARKLFHWSSYATLRSSSSRGWKYRQSCLCQFFSIFSLSPSLPHPLSLFSGRTLPETLVHSNSFFSLKASASSVCHYVLVIPARNHHWSW